MKFITLVVALLFSYNSLAFSFTNSFGSKSNPEFLPVEQAFILSVKLSDTPGVINATWNITPEYYLYKHQFKLLNNSPVPLQFQDLPTGKIKNDPYFGEVEIFRDTLTLPIRYADNANEPRDINFIIQYQGCADAGLCYPPQKTPVSLTLPPMNLGSDVINQSSTRYPDIAEGQASSIKRQLATGDTLKTLIIMLGLGLILTFTPCVLPMIPIVSAIVIGGKQKGWQGVGTTAIYVLGMSTTYALIGGLAAWFGTQFNLQAALQTPMLIVGSAVLFTLLGVGMLGAFNLSLPARLEAKIQSLSDSSRSKSGRYTGTFLAGVFATLVVSPCVSAPLAGAIVYISTSGDVLLGASALFVMGLGMGIPLLVVGALGSNALPKSGEWLSDVKVLMGFAMLGMSIWLLGRLIQPQYELFLWGTLFASLAAYFFKQASRSQSQLRWFIGVLAILMALLQWLGTSLGYRSLVLPISQPFANVNTSSPTSAGNTLAVTPQRTIYSLNDMASVIQSSDQPVMFDLYADWCISCQEIEHEIFNAADIAPMFEKVKLIRIDVTENSQENQALMVEYDLYGPPSMLFFDQTGTYLPDWTLIGEPTKTEVSARLARLTDTH